ncbi:MAG: tripartite tricarboxylate transporter TctB family protein [Synergistaceae bacterium]|nr:tripartite tricarboxylate transporter TctB family protein [Synergistaceae bacterium]
MFFRKYGDIVAGIFYAVLGAVTIYFAQQLPKSRVMKIGPDFMPMVIGILIFVLALMLLFSAVKNFKANAAKAEAMPADTSDYKRVLASLVLVVIYVNILAPVGFILSTLGYLFLQIVVLAPNDRRDAKNILTYAIIDVVFVFVVFFLFRYGFKIVLPAGMFTL